MKKKIQKDFEFKIKERVALLSYRKLIQTINEMVVKLNPMTLKLREEIMSCRSGGQ